MSDVSGPDFVTLLVRDLETSRHFYVDALGLRESAEKRPNAVAFETRPCGFAIRKAPDPSASAVGAMQGIILWFRATDAAALSASLRQRGVPITTPLADGPFGRTFTCRDPDGYLITVHDAG